MTRGEWLALGIAHGFIVGEPYCGAHDTPPLTADELEADDPLDVCVRVVRIDGPGTPARPSGSV